LRITGTSTERAEEINHPKTKSIGGDHGQSRIKGDAVDGEQERMEKGRPKPKAEVKAAGRGWRYLLSFYFTFCGKRYRGWGHVMVSHLLQGG